MKKIVLSLVALGLGSSVCGEVVVKEVQYMIAKEVHFGKYKPKLR
jgi:hypothetical protein